MKLNDKRIIVYLDLDQTILFKHKANDNMIHIEKDSTEIHKFFKRSYIHVDVLRKLKLLRELGVELVAVTARDGESVECLYEPFRKLFDRIYYGFSYNLLTDNIYIHDNFQRQIIKQRNYMKIRKPLVMQALKLLEISKDNIYHSDENSSQAIFVVGEDYVKQNYDKLRLMCKTLINKGILISYRFCRDFLELNLIDVDKGKSVEFDKTLRQPHLSFCLGDDISDLGMARLVNYAYFPLAMSNKIYPTDRPKSKVIKYDDYNWSLKALDDIFLKMSEFASENSDMYENY